jgi:hypothetical protein
VGLRAGLDKMVQKFSVLLGIKQFSGHPACRVFPMLTKLPVLQLCISLSFELLLVVSTVFSIFFIGTVKVTAYIPFMISEIIYHHFFSNFH